jgi:NAD(P)-dependent dehydrogenase (short-subunit alcohol dehydrogenase family)
VIGLTETAISILERDPAGDEADPECVLVAGASGGIGGAIVAQLGRLYPSAVIVRMARRMSDLPAMPGKTTIDVPLDLGEEGDIGASVARIPLPRPLDWVFIATGWLHDQGRRPEKTYKSLDPDHLLHAYRVNAVGPALLARHLIPRLHPSRAGRIGILSARVGSISDNRLGGWHAYRASKAALNMLIKNFAIELGRDKRGHVIVGLQPGTTDTGLSAPFQRNLPEGQLQTPEYTAEQLVKVMRRLRLEDSGELFDFLGERFAP